MFSDPTFLRIAVVMLGSLLLTSTMSQSRTGKTHGLTGKGRVYRDEEPAYFKMLLIVRVILGSAMVLLGLFLK
jgi:hypothetical protein